MDTRITTILTILALNLSTSFADNNVTFTEIRPVERTIMNLAPVSPSEADFSDPVPEATVSYASLMPETPKEATFDEESFIESINTEILPFNLSPSTPEKADFEELM